MALPAHYPEGAERPGEHADIERRRFTVARKVLDLTKATLLADNHFLAPAVGRLEVLEAIGLARPLATDGYALYLDANQMLDDFSRKGTVSAHDLMHSVAHCIFLHPYVGPTVERTLWNIACDIAAERVSLEVLGPRDGARGRKIQSTIADLERQLGCKATAEKIYGRLRAGKWARMLDEWAKLFAADDHEPWWQVNVEDPVPTAGTNGTGSSSNTQKAPEQPKSSDSQTQEPDKESDEAEREPDDGDPSDGKDEGDSKRESEGNGSDESEDVESNGREPDGDNSDDAKDEGDSERESEGNGSDESECEPCDDPSNAKDTGGSKHGSEGNGSDESECEPDGNNPNGARDTANVQQRSQGSEPGSSEESYRSLQAGMAFRWVNLPSREQQVSEWRDVASALAVNLQTYAKARGETLSGLVDELEQTSHEPVDYSEFLRQFAVPGEVMRLSDDEFDYVYYTYGIDLYGNVPLIEPLEYREEKRVREFVIAIDTSGSVQGEIVRDFVNATFDILKSTESFHSKVHVRILQCDTEVRSEDVITSLDELRDWSRSMKLLGGGGTDFRPVFRHVDALIEAGEFSNMVGLVYFTDGWGEYPDYMPAYRTAFAFYDDDFRPDTVPPWAIQVVLDKNAIEAAQQR
ncbi:MAG: VWA-like domain-containing protein [Coriobacteriaceae bacterium]|nr:VWA-like domain-containing protein [Coriobacteriaceae bacterium]